MTNSIEPFEKHLVVGKSDQTILQLLSISCPEISKQKLKQAMKYGAIWITPQNNQGKTNKTVRIRRAKKCLQLGDQVHLYYNPAILFSKIEPAQLVADEGEFSVWNKPCGMFSQGSKWGDHSAIVRWVEIFGLPQNNLPQRPCFLVHRLDRATSGLILVAHSKQAAQKLSRLFESRNIDKRYSAVINGQYPSSTLPQELDSDIDDKSALTIILSSEYRPKGNFSTLKIKIESGRKHQIRKHLSEAGYPVIGDRLYGNKANFISDKPIADLKLLSYFLEFNSPFSDKLCRYQIDYHSLE